MSKKFIVGAIVVASSALLLGSGCSGQKGSANSDAAPAAPVSQTASVTPRVAPVPLAPNEAVTLPLGGETNEPLFITVGDVVAGGFKAPRDGKLIGVSASVGTFINTSTGNVEIELCKAENCLKGAADLKTSLDNTDFTIGLATPLEVVTGDEISYRIKKVDGDVDVVIWTFPSSSDAPQYNTVIDGKDSPAGRSAKITLHYGK